jgi:diguanylate cyclase (GGDEF)-like protein/PAS domain S-box-containing protein
MRANDELYGKVMDNLHEGIYFVDSDRTITYWNKGAENLTGYAAKEMLGKRCSDDLLMHVDDRGTALCAEGCPLQKTMVDGSPCEAEVYLRHKSGHRLPVSLRVIPVIDPDNKLTGAVEIFTDHSERVALLQKIARLQRDALLDPLTGLANRRYATETLRSMLDQMLRYGWTFGILFMDIDLFKTINDTYGHDVGDQVIKMVARTLQANSRSFDIVARWGGEEFLAIIVNVNEENLHRVAYKLRTLVAKSSLHVGDERIGVTISLGATLARPEDTMETLVKRADQAMYRKKLKGRNQESTKIAV